MDDWNLAEDKRVRLSNSPASSPKFVTGPPSPAHSVHPESMDSINIDPDPGIRTIDFFDDSSSDDDAANTGRSHRGTRALETNSNNRILRSVRKDQGSYLSSNNALDFVSQCGDDKEGALPTGLANNQHWAGGGFLKLTSTPGPNAVKSTRFGLFL